MAKPDTDNGFFMLAYELLPPLMMCCQRSEAAVVLCEVLAQVYGREKKPTATLRPAKIAKRTGHQRPNIWRGIKELTDKGVIERLGDGTYRFEKDYEKWATPEGPVVPGPLAGYCFGYSELAKGREPESGPDTSVSRVDTVSAEANESSVSRVDTHSETASVSRVDTVRVSRVDTVCVSRVDTVSPPPPIGELEIERVVVVGGEPDEIPTPPKVVESDNASKAAGVPALNAQRPFKPAPAELARVKDMAEAIDPHAYLGQKVQAMSTLYPLDWIEDAFTLAAGQGERIAHYANSTLIRWWRQGHKDEPPADRPPVTDPFTFGPTPARAAPQSRVARSMAALDSLNPKRPKEST